MIEINLLGSNAQSLFHLRECAALESRWRPDAALESRWCPDAVNDAASPDANAGRFKIPRSVLRLVKSTTRAAIATARPACNTLLNRVLA